MTHTLASTADRIYWLGRYLERAESSARLIDVHANLLMDLPLKSKTSKDTANWQTLIDIWRCKDQFQQIHKSATEQNVIRFLTTETNYPGSLVNSLNSARENARTARGAMPRETFEYINDLYLYAKQHLVGSLSRSRRVETLAGVIRRIQQLDGFLSANMLHDYGWMFLRLGNHIERADTTTRIIDVQTSTVGRADEMSPELEQLTWISLLKSLHAMQGFNAQTEVAVERSPALKFLFQSPLLPRSLTRCVTAVKHSLRALPRHTRPMRSCNRLLRQLRNTEAGELSDPELHLYIDEIQLGLATLHKDLNRIYFQARLSMPKAKKTIARAAAG